MIETILYYQRLFDYSGDPLSLLMLPYNIFQDLIVKQIKMRKDEIKREKDERAKQNQERKNKKHPKIKADFMI